MRYLRGLLGLVFIGAILGLAGSYYMRRAVIQKLKTQAIASNSVVLSRPFPLGLGVNVKHSNLKNRAERLGYRLIESIPTRAGELFFPKDGGQAYLYLRGGRIAPGKEQGEQHLRLELEPSGAIASMVDQQTSRPVTTAWLEPEILSLLGSTETRATSPRKLQEFNEHLKEAILAIEDERFYSHFGIDVVAVIRALATNLRAGRVVQGGSTLTQQLAKNLFLESERTISRKLVEAFSAILIETAFSKDQIFEFYLNEIFLGQEGRVAIHGFGEASRSFFGKEAADLSLAEAATLAGIIKAPSAYSPRRYPKRAKDRRRIVLMKMEELGFINAKQRAAADAEPLKVISAQRSRRVAPYFVDYVQRDLERILTEADSESQTAKIYTGIDLEYQLCAEKAVEEGLAQLEKNYSWIKKSKEPVQSALVAVTPATGEILAWVGGRDFGRNQFDRVSLARRQPGSAFKPFVYLTALDRNLNTYKVALTTSLLEDRPISLPVPGGAWEPKNYDGKFSEEVTVREALTRSLNIPTVNLAMKVGIENVARTAELFGFGRNLPRVPSLALGAGEVTPLELAKAYATIANGGSLLELRPILSVVTGESGEPVFEAPLHERRVVDESSVFVLTNMLQSVVEHGTAQVVRRKGLTVPAAGKTGTTNDGRDSWFAGFTPRILAVVWVGFDSNKELKLTGSQAAAPIWTDFMRCVTEMEPKLDFIPPPSVVFRRIDYHTGLLDTGYCPSSQVVTEIFVEGTEPIDPCPVHSPQAHYGDEEYPPSQSGLPPARRERPRSGGSLSDFFDRLFDW